MANQKDNEKADMRMLTEVGMLGMCGYNVESTEKKVTDEELYGKTVDKANEK